MDAEPSTSTTADEVLETDGSIRQQVNQALCSLLEQVTLSCTLGGGNVSTSRRRNIRQVDDKFTEEDALEAQRAEAERRMRLAEARKRKSVEVMELSSSDDEDEDEATTSSSPSSMPKVAFDDGDLNTDVSKEADENLIINPFEPKSTTSRPLSLASHLRGVIKPHQLSGIRFMYQNVVESISQLTRNPRGFGCILAHSMGLGKTLQTCALVDCLLSAKLDGMQHVLIILPVNVLSTWSREWERWFPSADRSFEVYVLDEHYKTVEDRVAVIDEWRGSGGVLLIGYEAYCSLASRSYMLDKEKKKQKKRKAAEIDVVDIEQEEEEMSLLQKAQRALVEPGPDLVVCDEGHRIKNAKTNTANVLSAVRTRRRIVLTGYPLQNNLKEYWCMVHFVRPHYLGSQRSFTAMFERPILNGQCLDSTGADKKLMRQRSFVLSNLLRPFVHRRSHALLKDILPPKHEFVLFLKPTQFQRHLYEAFANYTSFMPAEEDAAQVNVIRAFAVCCKIWNHPDLLYRAAQRQADLKEDLDLDLEELRGRRGGLSTMSYSWTSELMENYQPGIVERGSKFVIAFELIRASLEAGDKILIFSQSLFSLNEIEVYLNALSPMDYNEDRDITKKRQIEWRKNRTYLRLDGSTSALDRQRLISRFTNEKSISLFLISTRAGSLGINLVAANRVIVLDASWNPCHDAQAVCRVYRYGQNKETFIYRLIMDNTMERTIYFRQIGKQGIADRVVDERGSSANVTQHELTSLLLDRKVDDGDWTVKDCNDWFDEFVVENYEQDPVIVRIAQAHLHHFSRKPLFHESLVSDDSVTLSTEEKQEAEAQYRMHVNGMLRSETRDVPNRPMAIVPPTVIHPPTTDTQYASVYQHPLEKIADLRNPHAFSCWSLSYPGRRIQINARATVEILRDPSSGRCILRMPDGHLMDGTGTPYAHMVQQHMEQQYGADYSVQPVPASNFQVHCPPASVDAPYTASNAHQSYNVPNTYQSEVVSHDGVQKMADVITID